MSEEHRQAPEPEEEKAIPANTADGGARLIPGRNIVEGEIEDGDRTPFPDTSPPP